MSSNWGLSSSSSDSDDDRPVSKFRTETLFYKQYYRGEYGDDWPDHLHHVENHTQNVQANSSVLIDNNDQQSTSFANISRIGLDDSHRVLSPSSLLTNTVEDIVLINEGGKYRPIRVISQREILPVRKSPEVKSKVKVETKQEEVPHVPSEIPLEKIDFIDPPKDPRKRKPESQYDAFDDDDNDGLALPKFYGEMVIKSEIAKNQGRSPHLNGSFKRSLSHVRQKAIQKAQRQHLAAPRTDPRIDRTLFSAPPRKVISPPKKQQNTSQPNIKSKSIFDSNEGTDDISSSSFSSSFSTPNASDDLFSGHNSTKINDYSPLSESDIDSDDNSFMAFSKRKLDTENKRPERPVRLVPKRKKYTESTSNDDEKVPPIRIDLKNKQVTPTIDKKKKKSPLFGKPPTVDKEVILSALTEDTDQENIPIVKTQSGNNKKSPKKRRTKLRPIFKLPSHNSKKSSSSDADAVHAPSIGVVHSKRLGTVIKITNNTISLNQEPAIDSISKQNETIKALDNVETGEPMDLNESDKSSTSNGSIERKLAAMTSPVRKASEVYVHERESLTDILSDERCAVENTKENPLIESNGLPAEEKADTSTLAAQILDVDSGIQTATQSPQSEIDSNSINANETDDNKIDKNVISTIPDICESVLISETTNTVEEKSTVETANIPTRPNCEQEEGTAVEPAPGEHLTDANISLVSGFESFELHDISMNVDLEEIANNLFDPNSTVVCDQSTDNSHKRPKVIINDFFDDENIPASLKRETLLEEQQTSLATDDVDISDDDYEDDSPCGIDELTLPNSNTHRNTVDNVLTICDLCPYQAPKGFKQLTKHYVRTHSDKEISISRLANIFNPQELQETKFTPLITKTASETIIRSLCYICNEGYNMSSSKWILHFISHTGEFEFQCNSCAKKITQDLHKPCNSKGNHRINGPFDFVDNTLYGYVCTLCNYIQLTKKHIILHLENEHHQLTTGDQNVIEIILLKTSQAFVELLVDDKNDKELMAAKERISAIHQPNRFQNCSPVVISESDCEPEPESEHDNTIDLTLTDDEI
ncbi:uncharacterized protein LOC116350755 [Contarinia nasturtii]|uniref:uncharacterized protein LOC116350755 n=1 Tax=Contarinia nasturtii TaxID=265458 RepID=UPI0012D3B68C|nr:uncharacterized protein LOC116350755 [Contarinia nasturtii]